ncbi:hypothetical protein DICPUDRAFT_49896 [Dictyostelium purpureum]|uniref:Protein kinase domain-containing protein n=1 Tax=Dictyostelium purpureum TaxID=5786 RepID=F0ZVT4_DICPU|nr:uncharacterized protein DICPUDRAFT_49896 [Dictyostelium purpureum]EGC31954.1 hypothetical protein DICPUDRAFT_49896 [Dictyostelium purpureum]|eukprot:XP_003291523.1 hypothetical protein DICPUDRAFT_49896 [Dictyostelium purpureum]
MSFINSPNDQLRIKCILGDDIRIIKVNANVSYDGLMNQLEQDFNTPILIHQYEDYEGDKVTVKSEYDIMEAISMYFELKSLNPSKIISTKFFLKQGSRNGMNGVNNIRPSSPIIMNNNNNNNNNLNNINININQSNNIVNTDFPSLIINEHEELISNHAIRWQKGQILGRGGYGAVYLGLNKDTGELFAVKQLEMTDMTNDPKLKNMILSFSKEIEVMKSLRHENIVRYLGTSLDQTNLSVFLEYIPGGSISSLLSKFGAFSENVIRVYTKQILQGLSFLHSNQIIHRDIKGANILIDTKGTVKLSDFGCSKSFSGIVSQFKSIQGTPYWMAPEVIKQTGHGRSSDIWSLGCVIVEMATGLPPWSNINELGAVMYHIASSNSIPMIPDHLSSEAFDFLHLCFNRDPKERPDANQLLKHPFITNLDESCINLVTSLNQNNNLLNINQPPQTLSSSPNGSIINNNINNNNNNNSNNSNINQQQSQQQNQTNVSAASSSSGGTVRNRFSISSGSTKNNRYTPPSTANLMLNSQQQLTSSGLSTSGQLLGINSLSKILLIQIFKNFLPKNVGVLSRVCKKWRIACEDEDLWLKFYSERLINKPKFVVDQTYRSYYINKVYKDQKHWFEKKITQTTLKGHDKTVFCVKIVSDQYALSGGDDKKLKIWDISSGNSKKGSGGKYLYSLKGHGNAVKSVDFQNDFSRVFTASSDFTSKIWNVKTKKALYTYTGHREAVTSINYLGDIESKCLTASLDKTIQLWDSETGSCLSTLRGHTDGILSVKYDQSSEQPNRAAFFNHTIVSASLDKTAIVWDTRISSAVRKFTDHCDDLLCCYVFDQKVITGSCDGKIKLWDIGTCKTISTFTPSENKDKNWVWCLQFDQSKIISSGVTGVIRIWDIYNERSSRIIGGHHQTIFSLHYKDQKLITGSHDKMVKIWHNED